jgi:hypothetical protein
MFSSITTARDMILLKLLRPNVRRPKTFDRRWWFEAPCLLVAVLLVQSLLAAAGLNGGDSTVARAAVWVLCFSSAYRVISFSAWLAVVVLWPQASRK